MENIYSVCSFLINRGIEEDNPITNISLQKLLYLAQGLHLSETELKLFHNKIYAWEYGPVVRDVYHYFKYFGKNPIDDFYEMDSILPPKITDNNFALLESDISSGEIDFLYSIWNSFKEYKPFELVQLTHMKGSPWYNIYQKYDKAPPRNIEITSDAMKDYFKTYFKRVD